MKNEIIIKDTIVVPEHELVIITSRAGGPGGQHVNKSSTKVTIHWNPEKSSAFTEEQKDRIIKQLGSQLTTDGELVIHNRSTRSQAQNKQLAFDEFIKRLRKALHVPKKRMKTKASAHSKEKRLKEKKERSEIKKMRNKQNF